MAHAIPRYAQEAFEFCTAIRDMNRREDVEQLIAKTLQNFGFEFVTCAGVPTNLADPTSSVLMNTRPQEYVSHYIEERLVLRDPVVTELRHTMRPYSWSDVRDRRDLSKQQSAIMNEAREFDVFDGLVIPIMTTSGRTAIFSPCGQAPELHAEARSAIEIVGIAAFQALSRLSFEESKKCHQAERLSDREREVLQWIAIGKSDDEIGEILSISKRTVTSHVENAKRKLNVYKRTMAVVEALRNGELAL